MQPGGLFELGTDGPRVIVVGVDGSTTSLRAGAYAAGMARRQNSQLVVVYVAGAATALAGMIGAADMLAWEADEQVADDLRRQVEEVAGSYGLRATFVAVHGDPYTELIEVAEQVRADAMVVGASMRAGHRFAGSLAIRLVRAGRWPVTVVP
jgi:nucleotide-binding universal stress UspA family protein